MLRQCGFRERIWCSELRHSGRLPWLAAIASTAATGFTITAEPLPVQRKAYRRKYSVAFAQCAYHPAGGWRKYRLAGMAVQDKAVCCAAFCFRTGKRHLSLGRLRGRQPEFFVNEANGQQGGAWPAVTAAGLQHTFGYRKEQTSAPLNVYFCIGAYVRSRRCVIPNRWMLLPGCLFINCLVPCANPRPIRRIVEFLVCFSSAFLVAELALVSPLFSIFLRNYEYLPQESHCIVRVGVSYSSLITP